MKGGFIVAGQYGDGALRERGRTVGYSGRSLHRWAFRRVLRRSATCCSFIDNDSLRYLDKSDGWELGTGPSLVVLDKGFGKNLSRLRYRRGSMPISSIKTVLWEELVFRDLKSPKSRQANNEALTRSVRSSRAIKLANCCATPAVATRRARCSPRSTTGSPKASTPPT